MSLQTYIVGTDVLRAHSPADLVAQLHRGSRAPAKSDAAWMEEAAQRLIASQGVRIDHRTPEAFVDDLIGAGLVVRGC